MKNMHLIGMRVSNFLRVESFDYQFDGKSVKLAGKNGAGKTSLLHAIWAACHGKKAVPKDPRHNGEKTGEIVLDLGELTIKRTFTEKNTYLTVTTKDGLKPKNPQVLLDRLVGTIALDPHAFMELAPKPQMEKAATIAGVADKIEKVDALLATVEEDRRFANRQARDLSGALNAMPEPECDGTVQDTEGLEKQIDDARAANDAVSDADKSLEYINSGIDDIKQFVKATKRELTELAEKLAKAKEDQSDAKRAKTAAAAKVKKIGSVDDIRAELETIRASNEAVRQDEVSRSLYDQKHEEYAEAKKAADALDERVKKGRAKREDIIKNANLPVDGIDFSEDGLVYNGHPFTQASHAEQLRVSIGILMAQNPGLRLLTIKDASLMDADSWKVVEKLGKEYKFQVIYEVVSDKAKAKDSGLFIADGALTHVDGKKVEAKKKDEDERGWKDGEEWHEGADGSDGELLF